MLFKLLWRNQPLWQLLGASLGALVGITLLLVSLQGRESFNHLLEKEDELFPPRYLTLSKKISILNNLPGMRPSFSKREINKLKHHPGIMDATPFKAADFKSLAIMAIPNLAAYQTELFLESLPAHFLESLPKDWDWQPGNPYVPILLPNSFLHLYNFGFAPANGYPQISKGMVNKVNFTLHLRNNEGDVQILPARIAAFSDRITTILVPDPFMAWASEELATGKKTLPPYRILVKTRTPIPQELTAYLEKEDYETNQELLKGAKAAGLAKLALGGTGAIGLLLLLLAFLAFWLSFQMLVQRSANQLRTLLHIGYPPGTLSKHYLFVFLGIGMILFIMALLAASLTMDRLASMVSNHGIELVGRLSGRTLSWAFLPTAVLILAQCTSMRSTLEKLARS